MAGRRQRIADRAYGLWEAEGRRHGNDLAHWFRAEAETPLHVTFDSNVWEDVVSPDRLSGKPERQQQAARVRGAIERGEVIGFFSEGWTTLEALEKRARAEFFANQVVEPRLFETVLPDGTLTTGALIGPNQSHRPPLSPKVCELLTKATALGLRLLTVPRYHELSLPPEFFAAQTDEIATRTGSILAAIESRGVGKARVLEFGLELARTHFFSGTFFEIPPVNLQPDESRTLARLVAEWADGDALAAHVGYANDIFCTEDFGRSSRGASVLDESHREWLTKTFGIQFATLGELAQMVVR
ncbi:DUF2934 domain-containing protein [Roseiarcus sp.]|uniref:DUF2934 domain-containing protein n=1 Tax=Roseiarcus sp. TaxID=1969460 RepID=UPI003F9E7CFB